jgi:hypothetical protein
MSLIDATHRNFLARVDRDMESRELPRREVVIYTPTASYTVDVECGDWRLVRGSTRLKPSYRSWDTCPTIAIADVLDSGSNCRDWALTRKALLALSACDSPEDAFDTKTGEVLLPEVEEWLAAADEDFAHMVRAEVER